MLELLLRERVAAEVGARSDVHRNLTRGTVGKDSAQLFSRHLISKMTKMWGGKSIPGFDQLSLG